MKDYRDIPASVEKISIDGIRNTDHEFIKKQLESERLFSAKNVEEVVEAIASVKERLHDLDIFSSIKVKLDKADGLELSQQPSKSAKLHVIFTTDEMKQRKFDARAMCGLDNSVGIDLQFSSQNVCGRAGKIVANYHNNVKAIGGRSFYFLKPLEGYPKVKCALGIWQNDYDHWWSRFIESTVGGFGEVSLRTSFGEHQCRFETLWREMNASVAAPLEVVKENGHTMKALLKHTFTRDTRDDRIYPEQGYHISMTQEFFSDLAALPDNPSGLANVNVKLETELKKSFTIGSFTIENTIGLGLIRSLIGDGCGSLKVPIADRFFVGGPLTMRGFELRSVGPLTDNGVPLGSNGYVQHGLHVYSPLPYFGKEGFANYFRLHGFITSASTDLPTVLFSSNIEHGNPCGDGRSQVTRMGHFLSTFRSTAGFGVIFKLANTFRIEVNYCLPVYYQPRDRIVSGFQFGIGILYA